MHVIAVLAAGQSVRFGPQNKLAAPIDGTPMLSRVCARALNAGADDVAVFLSDPELVTHVPKAVSVHYVIKDEPFSTRLHAVAQYADLVCARSVTIVLGDMPSIRADHLRRLRAACPKDGASRTVAHGGAQPYAGVPVCLTGAHINLLRSAQADRGLASIWSQIETSVDVPVDPDQVIDIDTPDDLSKLRN